MSKTRRPAKGTKPATRKAGTALAVMPDYYRQFQCIGSDCEDTCCAGWSVEIDAATWHRYRSSQHEKLAPLFRSAVEELGKTSQTRDKFARFKIRPDGTCQFLEADRLCMIQRELGGDALSDTCALYPRQRNEYCDRLEYGLALSCPEAARLALLHPEPIRMIRTEPDAQFSGRDAVNYRVIADAAGNPGLASLLDDYRKTILDILQCRKLSSGARVMVLGCLLDEAGRVGRWDGEFARLLASFRGLFADPASVEAQYEQIPSELPRRLQVITGFLANYIESSRPRLTECMLAAIDDWMGGGAPGDNVVTRYLHAYENYYLPYMREKGYILENYLVTCTNLNLFPFARGNPFELYRELVCNLAIIQVILVGMAGHYKGLTDDKVIQLIQSFVRMTAHHTDYLSKLNSDIGISNASSFADVMWMLKER
jgi:lysine-N-methylase